MQFGIFSVSDITPDPTTGRAPSEAERIKAMVAIAKEAIQRNVGARGLRIIMEEIMLDLMYSIPSRPDVKEVVITEDVVANQVQPMMLYRQAG